MTLIQHTVDYLVAQSVNQTFTLNIDTKNILDFLDSQIIVPIESVETTTTYIRKPVEQSTYKNISRPRRSGPRNSSKDNLMQDWEAIRNFKTTEIIKTVGFDQELSIIRVLLNKLSAKNYDTQKDIIIEKVKSIITDELNQNENSENIQKIGNLIFDITCSNRFLSELYTNLYVELVGINDVFGDILDSLLVNYRNTMNSISYVDPNENYDKFCDYNKANEIRRANAAFIMNLAQRDQIKRHDILNIIIEIQAFTLKLIDEENRKNEVDEITENMFILYSMGKVFLDKEPLWNDNIKPFVCNFSKKKAKEYKSLSSRCIFKYMDMIGK
jgi:hypothetical protein